MKIAILTYYRAFSYGALLQCYALSKLLCKEGHEVKMLRSDLRGETTIKYKINSLTKCSNFRQFRKKNLPVDAKLHEEFDLYIVGSDQVWNPEIPLKPLDYFFSFLPDSAKRISYAASFGMDKWEYNDTFTKQVYDCLNKFSLITVREENAVEICRDIFDCHADVVLDPTLLLGDFQDLYSVPNHSNGTLFYYRVSQRDDWGNLAIEMAEDLGLKLYSPSLRKRVGYLPELNGLNTSYPSVQEWLDMIRSSSFVLTDSFHTVVFAILNRKPFVVLPSVKSGMGRVISLLSQLNISGRYYSTEKDVMMTCKWKEKIDYDMVYSLLTEKQNISMNILRKYIK